MITGNLQSARTGRNIRLTNNPVLNRLSVLLGSAEAKTTPAISTAIDMLRGQDFKGDETRFSKEVVDLFIPIVVGDLYQLARTDPALLPTLGTAAFFGVGVQPFSDKHESAEDATRALEGVAGAARDSLGLGRKRRKRRFIVGGQ